VLLGGHQLRRQLGNALKGGTMGVIMIKVMAFR